MLLLEENFVVGVEGHPYLSLSSLLVNVIYLKKRICDISEKLKNCKTTKILLYLLNMCNIYNLDSIKKVQYYNIQ